MKKLLLLSLLLSSGAFAQNATSGSPRVQGVPAGYGDPVQVTIRNTDGSAPTSNIWSYAAATGGISNTTTAVTIKAAAGASVRNYITSIQYDFQALTTATELAVRDGAGGMVLWRGYIPASTAGMREITFGRPLQGTANTLLEVVTLTASGAGAVFVNVQGFTGS